MNLYNKIVAWLLSFTMVATAADPNSVLKEGLALPLSQKSVDMILFFEVGGSKEVYTKNYAKPIVPAWQTTQSGVTVGIGYDVGHYSKDQIARDLKGIASDEEIKLLQSVAGLKGKSAYYNGLPKVRHTVYFTYEDAEKLFLTKTLPSFTKQTATAFVLTPDKLHPHSNGALTSLVYNRGAALDQKDSRKEMRWIKYNISINKEDRVPSDIRSMKRLWSYAKLKGLHTRRDAEAKLFQEGLDLK